MKTRIVRIERFYYVDEDNIQERIDCDEDREFSEDEKDELAESIAWDWFESEFNEGSIDLDSFTTNLAKVE